MTRIASLLPHHWLLFGSHAFFCAYLLFSALNHLVGMAATGKLDKAGEGNSHGQPDCDFQSNSLVILIVPNTGGVFATTCGPMEPNMQG
jgi:hypothetical protein